LLAAATGLGACENLADMIPDSKKPLPGERKLLFPEGVPGVTQGVPPELMRNSQQPDGQPAQAGIATPQAEPQPQAEEAPKPKPKPRTVRRKPPAQPQEPQEAPAAQQPQQASPWPSSQPQQQPQNSPWPSAPPAGTFSR
jgi:hypothetical protein